MAEFANGAQGVMAGFFPASHAARRTERPQASSKDERLCDCLPLTPGCAEVGLVFVTARRRWPGQATAMVQRTTGKPACRPRVDAIGPFCK
jgi:hypothetical protein